MGLVRYVVSNSDTENVIQKLGNRYRGSVSKKEWKELELKGHKLVRKEYLLLTSFLFWFDEKFSRNERFTIVMFVITTVIGIIVTIITR
jgi:hypothetical protein